MSEERDFYSEITGSSRELTAKEKVMLKDTQDAQNLNNIITVSDTHSIIIDVDLYAYVHVHNVKAENDPDYDLVVIVSKDGEKYVTGSTSFRRQFESIMDDMSETTEEWKLKVYGRPSKNYTGRDFLTCSVI